MLNPNSLITLELTITDKILRISMLPQISSFVKLRRLSITYAQELVRELPASDMLPLKNLKHLRKLEIDCLALNPDLAGSLRTGRKWRICKSKLTVDYCQLLHFLH